MVNRVGSTFVDKWPIKQGGVPPTCRTYTVTRDAFSVRSLWGDIEALDQKVPSAVQHRMIAEGVQLVERATLWFLGFSPEAIDISKTDDLFRPALTELAGSLSGLLPKSDVAALDEQAARLAGENVPEALARRVTALRRIGSGLDIVQIASETKGASVSDVATVYFTAGDQLGHDWLRQAAASLPADTYWRKQARRPSSTDSTPIKPASLRILWCKAVNARPPLRPGSRPTKRRWTTPPNCSMI